MKNKLIAAEVKKVNTTVGELIEALTKIASEHSRTEKESYYLAYQAWDELVREELISKS